MNLPEKKREIQISVSHELICVVPDTNVISLISLSAHGIGL